MYSRHAWAHDTNCFGSSQTAAALGKPFSPNGYYSSLSTRTGRGVERLTLSSTTCRPCSCFLLPLCPLLPCQLRTSLPHRQLVQKRASRGMKLLIPFLSTAAGQAGAPNCVEASGIVLSRHTKDLQHQSMKMKGQILRLSACMHIASRGIKSRQHRSHGIYIYELYMYIWFGCSTLLRVL